MDFWYKNPLYEFAKQWAGKVGTISPLITSGERKTEKHRN
jgi:hypothetical protein